MLIQQLLDESVMPLGNHCRQALDAGRLTTALTDVLGGHREVDAVGPAADVVVDPGELDLQLFGVEGERAEDAEPAGLADLHHHVPAVGESEQRELDAEGVANGRFHGAVGSMAQL